MSRGAKVWIALWVVYIVWGSTYLGIELVGETMPGLFGAGVRFTIAGLLMLGFIAWRRGPGTLRVRRAELASATVVGLPGTASASFISSLSVSPDNVRGGASSQGTVTTGFADTVKGMAAGQKDLKPILDQLAKTRAKANGKTVTVGVKLAGETIKTFLKEVETPESRH